MALEGLTPALIEKFGGLDIQSDPEEVGSGAVDANNVDFDAPGIVRSRDGAHGWFTSPTAGRNYFFLWPYASNSSGGKLIAARVNDAGTGTILQAISTAPAVVASSAALTNNPVGAVNYGTPSASYAFFTTDQTVAPWQYDGASFTQPAGIPTGRLVGSTPWDNRLVVANTAGGSSRVQFSDPGAPTTFGANNYVDLTPGDGEQIMAVQAWRDMLFVWKNTKGFVFYGTSTDSTGNPIFNYRPLVTGIGPRGLQQGVVAGQKGLYILDPERGVFVTTGGVPQLVSGPVTPVFKRRTTTFFSHTTIGQPSAVTWTFRAAGGRVFFSYEGGTLVFHEEAGFWTYWTLIDPHGFCEFVADTGRTDVFYVQGTGNADVMRFRPEYTGDMAYGGSVQTLSSYVVTGFMDLGSPGKEKVIQKTQLTGQGTVSFGWARDFATSPTVSAVTLGTAPATARGLHQVAARGETLSFKLSRSGTDAGAAWQVNRVVPMVRSVRGAVEKTT